LIQTHEDFGRREPQPGSTNRSFGLVVGGFFLILGSWPLWSGGHFRRWSLAAGAVLMLIAILYPSLLQPLNRIWTRLGLLLGRVTNPLIMALMFYLVFTPFAVFIRLIGKDLLRLKFDPEADSYWISRDPPGPEPDTMQNQF
jgi:hypothetical protein